MTTRRALILKWAEDKSLRLIDRLPPNNITLKDTFQKVYIVCKALVDRKRPRYPTAAEVAESGQSASFGFDKFPSKQTLYNQYGEMLAKWRKAYSDIQNLEAESVATDDFLAADVGHLDVGTQEFINGLKRLVLELTQRNNALKQLITDHVPVYIDHLGPEHGDLLDDLEHWMNTVISLDGFAIREYGLIVTPRTPPDTIIMHFPLWEGLERLVTTYKLAKKSENNFD